MVAITVDKSSKITGIEVLSNQGFLAWIKGVENQVQIFKMTFKNEKKKAFSVSNLCAFIWIFSLDLKSLSLSLY